MSMSEMRSSWDRYRTFHILTIWSAQCVCTWTSPLDLKVMLFCPTKCHLTVGVSWVLRAKDRVCVCLFAEWTIHYGWLFRMYLLANRKLESEHNPAALHSSTQLNQIQSPGNTGMQCACECVQGASIHIVLFSIWRQQSWKVNWEFLNLLTASDLQEQQQACPFIRLSLDTWDRLDLKSRMTWIKKRANYWKSIAWLSPWRRAWWVMH